MNDADELVSADVDEGDLLLQSFTRVDENIEAQPSDRERVGLLLLLEPEGIHFSGLEREGVGNKEVGI